MATQTRRPIGPGKAGAQTATGDKKADDVVVPADDTTVVTPAEEVPVEENEPIDVNSADYQAGWENAKNGIDPTSANYKAGAAAWKGTEGGEGGDAAPADSAPAPADDAPAASKAGRPASLAELEALAPDDPKFVLAQAKAGATLAQAQTAAIRALQETAKKERAARVAAEQKLAAETASPGPARIRRGPAAGGAASDTDTPEAIAKKEWAANTDDCRAAFASEAVYVAARKREMAAQGRH